MNEREEFYARYKARLQPPRTVGGMPMPPYGIEDKGRYQNEMVPDPLGSGNTWLPRWAANTMTPSWLKDK